MPGAAAPDQSHAANNTMADVRVDAEIVATELADKVTNVLTGPMLPIRRSRLP